MRSRNWIMILGTALVLCIGLSLGLLAPRENAGQAQIESGGHIVKTVSLNIDQQFTVTTETGGENVITVQNGKIAVTDANCPDHYCMKRGFCAGGTEIVCLPNRLVIRFLRKQAVDAQVG